MYSARISDLGLISLASFEKLRRLELCGGYLTNAGLEVLTRLTNLRDLNLSHNNHVSDRRASQARGPV